MNPIAAELNQRISSGNGLVGDMLSAVGRELFFPKGILSQSAEAKQKAYFLNATIGIATEKDGIMALPSIRAALGGFSPAETLTYAPSFGIPQLRSAWKDQLYEKNPSLAGKDISLPVVSSGITHGIATIADMFINPGDVIICPDMFWGNYSMIFSVRKGGIIKTFPLFSGQGYNVEGLLECVEQSVTQTGKALVLLNFPHNPTGYTITEQEAEKIVQGLTAIAESGANLVCVCDDAYFGLVYEDGVLSESIFARLCGLHPRLLAVKLDGATKEDYVWGLRIGFVTYGAVVEGDPAGFYDALERKTAGCIRGTISNCSHLGQRILLSALGSATYKQEKQEKYEILRQRAKKVGEVARSPEYVDFWDVYPFNSGYFMCIRIKGVDAEKLRVHLLEKYGLGLISMGAVNLRVAFSCTDAGDIEALFATIKKGIQDLRA